jgi:hypothetical protein
MPDAETVRQARRTLRSLERALAATRRRTHAHPVTEEDLEALRVAVRTRLAELQLQPGARTAADTDGGLARLLATAERGLGL